MLFWYLCQHCRQNLEFANTLLYCAVHCTTMINKTWRPQINAVITLSRHKTVLSTVQYCASYRMWHSTEIKGWYNKFATRDVPQGKLLRLAEYRVFYDITRRVRVSMTSRAMGSTLLPFWFSCI